jgi:hypothetical protein
VGLERGPLSLVSTIEELLFIIYLLLFLQSTQDMKRVINKRDGCEYLKQVPSIDGSLELI